MHVKVSKTPDLMELTTSSKIQVIPITQVSVFISCRKS